LINDALHDDDEPDDDGGSHDDDGESDDVPVQMSDLFRKDMP
jgi:hypothetical protein